MLDYIKRSYSKGVKFPNLRHRQIENPNPMDAEPVSKMPEKSLSVLFKATIVFIDKKSIIVGFHKKCLGDKNGPISLYLSCACNTCHAYSFEYLTFVLIFTKDRIGLFHF